MENTQIIAPKTKDDRPLAAITDPLGILNRQQVEELIAQLIAPSSNLAADVFKVVAEGEAAMAWVGNSIFFAGDGDNNNKKFGANIQGETIVQRLSNFEHKAEIVDIALGTSHSMIVLEDGSLWMSGGSDQGQIGNGIYNTTDRYIQAVGPWAATPIVKCWASRYNSFVLDDNGVLYSCGQNSYGSLGLGDTLQHGSWTAVNTTNFAGQKVVQLGGDIQTTMILTDANELYACGRNDHGQLGNGGTANSTVFVRSTTQPVGTVTKLIANDRAFMVLLDDRTLWYTGYNGGNVHGDPGGADNIRETWTYLPSYVDIIDVAGGNWFDYNDLYTGIVALKSNGQLQVSGHNNSGWPILTNGVSSGYISSPTALSKDLFAGADIIAVWGGGLNRYALDEVGNLWAWGRQLYGQCLLNTQRGYDDDTVDQPRTCTPINDARLFMAIQNLERGYSHPVIPQIVQQTTVLGGGGDYTYRRITGHATQNITTLIEDGGSQSVSYALSGFQGPDLDTSGIRKIYLKIEGKQGGDAIDTGNVEVHVTYPDGTEHMVFRWDPVATSLSDTEFGDMVEIPIARNQLTFDIRLVADNFSNNYDYIQTTIIGVEEYVSNGNAGLAWTVIEKAPNGSNGTTLLNNTWSPIPFTDDLGTNPLQGASRVGSDITLPAGKYELTLQTNIVPAGYGINQYAGIRMWNVTTDEAIQRLPNINPMMTIDYYGNGHYGANGQTTVIDVDFAEETTFRFEVRASGGNMRTGWPSGAAGDEYFSRLRIVGGASLTPAGTWDYDSGWIADWGAANPQVFTHNLAADAFSAIVIQMKDGNNIPIQYNGTAIGENRAPGEFNIGYGPRVMLTNTNSITLDVPAYAGASAWMPTHADNPPGWAGNQPTHLRVLIRR